MRALWQKSRSRVSHTFTFVSTSSKHGWNRCSRFVKVQSVIVVVNGNIIVLLTDDNSSSISSCYVIGHRFRAVTTVTASLPRTCQALTASRPNCNYSGISVTWNTRFHWVSPIVFRLFQAPWQDRSSSGVMNEPACHAALTHEINSSLPPGNYPAVYRCRRL